MLDKEVYNQLFKPSFSKKNRSYFLGWFSEGIRKSRRGYRLQDFFQRKNSSEGINEQCISRVRRSIHGKENRN